MNTPTVESARDLFWRLRFGYLHHKPTCTTLHGEFDCSCGLVAIIVAMRAFE